MIFWRGNGVFVLLYGLAVLLLSLTVGGIFLGYADASTEMAVTQLCSSILLAFPFWKYGKKVNSIKHEFIDKNTGKDVTIHESHTLFFIPMQYWAIIIPIGLSISLIDRLFY